MWQIRRSHIFTAQVDRACLSVPKGCRETLHHACGTSRGGMRGEWEEEGRVVAWHLDQEGKIEGAGDGMRGTSG